MRNITKSVSAAVLMSAIVAGPASAIMHQVAVNPFHAFAEPGMSAIIIGDPSELKGDIADVIDIENLFDVDLKNKAGSMFLAEPIE